MASPSLLSTGSLTPWSTWGEFNNVMFAVMQAISKLETATMVRVEACSNTGGVSPVGTVDITPLVNQIDGNGNSYPHGTIYGIPYLRMQGGSNAVILDPQAGDLGVAVFASRDLSKVISIKTQAPPGSLRSYNFSDGLYLGGMLNAVPQQYVQFTSNGITVSSPGTVTIAAPTIAMQGSSAITLTSPDIEMHGAVTISQGLSVTGNVTGSGSMAVTGDITGNGTSLHTHTHTSEAAGSPTSPPL